MGADSFVAYVGERFPELWLRIGEHLMLTGCSTLAAMGIGVPLGVLLFRNTWLRGPVMGAVGILQTIPSLAMLVFLLAMLQKIGAVPALIALTLYALLPIVRNTLAGLDGVSPEVMEAAIGIGMTEYQQMRMVRVPLAAPVIIAGIKTAAVVSVGIATLSAFIGAGGLGQFINRGLALSNTRLILLGAIPAAMLALMVDFSIGAFEWGVRPEGKKEGKKTIKGRLRSAALAMPGLLIILGIVSYLTGPGAGSQGGVAVGRDGGVVRIGSKNFTEQLILGHMMAQLIEAKTHLSVEQRFNLGGTMICHGALVNGEIDLYAEYTGTGLTAVLKSGVISDAKKALGHVRKEYQDRFDLRWLEPLGFNNTYTITVRAAQAREEGWKKISDLQGHASQLRAGFTAEFAERPDGYPGLRRAYGIDFGEVKDLDPSLMYEAIRKGELDVICAFATDGRIAAYDLKPLEDDKGFFPPYFAAPVVREQALKDHPELVQVLEALGGIVDDGAMQRLNYEVDGNNRSPAEVAEEYLRRKGLI